MNLYRNVKGSNNHFTPDKKYLVFYKSDFIDGIVQKIIG